MYLDSLRADLRADLHILLDNHDFTEVFLRNLPRQRNSVCGFWVCEMVEQVMQAVRNPLAMPAPLRFGNCWPPEEHLVNKWRGFMARPHPQLDEGGDGGGAGDDESLLPASTTSAEGAASPPPSTTSTGGAVVALMLLLQLTSWRVACEGCECW